MIHNADIKSSGSRGGRIGVKGIGPPKEIYVPKRDNPAVPRRPGSKDAFSCPSLGPFGERKPFWGSK